MNRKQLALLTTILALAATALLPGCATYTDLPAGTRQGVTCAVDSAIVEKEPVTVPPLAPAPPPARDYLIGPSDVLYVNVSGRPELLVTGTSTNSKVQGSRVDGSGNVQLPLVGPVPVAGLTVAQAGDRIRDALRQYLKDPWVVVEVAEYKSQPLYLLGQFRKSGVVYMDRPVTLVQGVALGDGFDAYANMRSARLTRGGKILPVDLYDLLTRGDQSQNVWLQGGDTLFIPDNRSQQVFVFGAVKKPGPVPIQQGGLNLAQAIASAELRDVGYDFRHVRIIRSLSTTRGELLVVDFDKVLRGEAIPLPLMEGDIVYVPKNGFGTWNEIINEILPSLQTVSAILQPFVSIKYLGQ